MSALQIICVLFAIAAVFGMISVRWLKLPITVGTMLLTVVASGVLIAASPVLPQIHQWALDLAHRVDFESVILHGMLPLLLFAGAFLLDLEQLSSEKLTVALLAVVGTVFSVFLVAGLMFVMPGIGIPWIQCLIFGALISPTDPVAVLEMLRRVGVSKSIQAQLAGESLFNDGIGAVLFLTMIDVARGQSPTALHVGEFLLLKAGGAIVAGIAAAWFTSQLMRRVNSYQIDILFTITLALGGYVVADLLHLSAPLEAVVAGIALRVFIRDLPKQEVDHGSVDGFWEVIDEIQNSVLFVLLGLEILAVPSPQFPIRPHLGRSTRRSLHRARALCA
jgi:CPA1 family monovalent cation:H+ antiporter